MDSGTYHYPPDLFALIKDAIPKLNRGKKDLLIFFRGCGISQTIIQPYEELLRSDKNGFNKYHVTGEILEKVNQSGDVTLALRREIIKRISEFHNFSGCYDNDRAAAIGLVAQIKDYVRTKDFITRTQEFADVERSNRLAEQVKKTEKIKRTREAAEKIKQELYALFDNQHAQQRGIKLEKILNDLFQHYGISVRESFNVTGKNGEGIIEQIDGVIEFKGHFDLLPVFEPS